MTNEITTTEQTQELTINNIINAPVGQMITSIKGDPADRATAVKIFNAMNNPAERISAHINEEIEVQDYLVEMAQIQDEDEFGNTLETYSVVPRVVLLSPDGTSYQATSFGIARMLRNVIATCGDAPWEPSVRLKIKQQPTKKGSMLTADMIG